jgi:hypothetical protein
MTAKRNFQHKTKYKSTGFTRFLLFLLWFAPLSYAGLMVYEGKNPINEAKTFINKFTSNDESNVDPSNAKVSPKDLERTIKSLEKELSEVKGDLARCSKALQDATLVE